MSYDYYCGFSKYIYDFIAEKHALGYPYLESERVIHSFDKYCSENFPEENTITIDIINAWAIKKETEKSVSFQNRIAPIRELAKYMNRAGHTACLIPPELSPKCEKQYQPHIFSKDELQAFFDATDSYAFNPRSRLRHLQVPVYFRLLYCCGLRPQEARLIKLSDLSLSTKSLVIPESKGHKDRMIIIPDALVSVLEKYDSFRKKEFPQGEYLFPCQRYKGNPYGAGWVRNEFHDCWNSCHFDIVSGNPPRPYDFRHTFATYRIYEWMKQDVDLRSMLPYLSAYMGHEHISQTAYYIHLVPEFFAEMSGMDMNKYASLIPEVPHE